jgi:hypothetical protein
MTEKDQMKELLNCLYQDLNMLKAGTWEPDKHSCNASLDVIENLAELCGVTIDIEVTA